MARPDLSIIVPVLNEEGSLPRLLDSLADQRGVRFELIVVDGGSTDGSAELLQRALPAFSLQWLKVPAGRAHQLNAGAALAQGRLLLFLHADSQFSDPRALAQAVAMVDGLSPTLQAGRFRLSFRREQAAYGFGFFFWECKARLDRPACIHGDQGLLVARELFSRCGPFDERLPLAPETWFADRVRHECPWQLFPAVIETSARRFEVEGLAQRQTLNALLMNFATIGWDAFFGRVKDIYRSQDRATALFLKHYVALIDSLLDGLPARERRRLWMATGRFVRSHAWQIPFALDARRGFSRGRHPDQLSSPLLNFHDRWFERFTDNSCGRVLAAVLTWLWFRNLARRLRRG